MSTCGGCFQLMPERFIDPYINIDYDAVREITDILSTYPEPRQDCNEFVLYVKNNTYSSLWYERDPYPRIGIVYCSRLVVTGAVEILLSLVIPPNKSYGLTRKNVESMWNLIDLLETEGWSYDKKLTYNPYLQHIHDFPPPEERPKLIYLLKRLFSFPLTKACK